MAHHSISPSPPLSLSCSVWAQCSLTYFTKWVHFVLSITNLQTVPISLLHQFTRSSVHLLFSLPLLFLSSIMAKTTCLISLSSGIRHMWPKKFSFLSIILCTMLTLRRPIPILFMIFLFLIFCCHFMFNILRKHFISKAHRRFMSFLNAL